MTIDNIVLYIGIASGFGILAMLAPGYFKRLLNESPKQQPKSVLR